MLPPMAHAKIQYANRCGWSASPVTHTSNECLLARRTGTQTNNDANAPNTAPAINRTTSVNKKSPHFVRVVFMKSDSASIP